jgi:hypothetical protein
VVVFGNHAALLGTFAVVDGLLGGTHTVFPLG